MDTIKLTLAILFTLFYLKASSQQDYFVKNNGDTIKCEILELRNLPSKKFFGGFKAAKNLLVYRSIDNKDKQEIEVSEVAAVNPKNVMYCVRKKLMRYRLKDRYGVDAIYDFFPLENGRYQRNMMQILNKDSIRFYKVADEMNAVKSYSLLPTAISSGSVIGSALGGAALGFRDVPYAYYVEKSNSGELFELPRKPNVGANILDGWKILKELLKDNPEVMKQLDDYIADNKKATKTNIEAIILSYTGVKFDDLPKIQTEKYLKGGETNVMY